MEIVNMSYEKNSISINININQSNLKTFVDGKYMEEGVSSLRFSI